MKRLPTGFDRERSLEVLSEGESLSEVSKIKSMFRDRFAVIGMEFFLSSVLSVLIHSAPFVYLEYFASRSLDKNVFLKKNDFVSYVTTTLNQQELDYADEMKGFEDADFSKEQNFFYQNYVPYLRDKFSEGLKNSKDVNLFLFNLMSLKFNASLYASGMAHKEVEVENHNALMAFNSFLEKVDMKMQGVVDELEKLALITELIFDTSYLVTNTNVLAYFSGKADGINCEGREILAAFLSSRYLGDGYKYKDSSAEFEYAFHSMLTDDGTPHTRHVVIFDVKTSKSNLEYISVVDNSNDLFVNINSRGLVRQKDIVDYFAPTQESQLSHSVNNTDLDPDQIGSAVKKAVTNSTATRFGTDISPGFSFVYNDDFKGLSYYQEREILKEIFSRVKKSNIKSVEIPNAQPKLHKFSFAEYLGFKGVSREFFVASTFVNQKEIDFLASNFDSQLIIDFSNLNTQGSYVVDVEELLSQSFKILIPFKLIDEFSGIRADVFFSGWSSNEFSQSDKIDAFLKRNPDMRGLKIKRPTIGLQSVDFSRFEPCVYFYSMDEYFEINARCVSLTSSQFEEFKDIILQYRECANSFEGFVECIKR